MTMNGAIQAGWLTWLNILPGDIYLDGGAPLSLL